MDLQAKHHLQPIRVLDLFSGCGGLAAGFGLAVTRQGDRFRCLGAIDNWKPACESFELNHCVEAMHAPVSLDAVRRVLSSHGDADVICGGPPCQGFSTSGKRALDDPRNELVKSFLEVIREVAPKAFVLENVVGFTTFQDGRLMDEVMAISESLGFSVFPGVVLASLFGVPQRRRRFILVGIRGGNFRFPLQRGPSALRQQSMFESLPPERELLVDQTATDGVEAWTFDDATSDLPTLAAGESVTSYDCAPQNDYQLWARSGATQLRDHIAVNHNPAFIELMSFIPQGRSAMEPDVRKGIPNRLLPKSGFPNSYARIRGDLPSPTITRNFTTPSSANCIHPRMDRALSIREGARCQSFQDTYQFCGTLGDRRLQIGNAVPPLLGKAIGLALLEALVPMSVPIPADGVK